MKKMVFKHTIRCRLKCFRRERLHRYPVEDSDSVIGADNECKKDYQSWVNVTASVRPKLKMVTAHGARDPLINYSHLARARKSTNKS